MAENNGRLLDMYDELSAFLTKISSMETEVFQILMSWPCFWNCITLTLGLGQLVCTNHQYCFACYIIA